MRVRPPEATFYVWAACPEKYDSMTFATKLLDEAAVVVIPGVGFGKAGEGYFRAALTMDTDRIREGIDRLAKVKL